MEDSGRDDKYDKSIILYLEVNKMYGVIDFSSEHISNRYDLILYGDLQSAISYFFSVNENSYKFDENSNMYMDKQAHIEPNINNNAHIYIQYPIFNIQTGPYLEDYNIKMENVLNIGLKRDEKTLESKLSSVLLSINKKQLKSYKDKFNIEIIKLKTEVCGSCKCEFKIHDINSNAGYNGSVYNPLYYYVVTLDNIRSHDIYYFEEKFQTKLDELNFEKSKTFCLNIKGYLDGLKVAKFALPDDWYNGMIICCECINNMKDKFHNIWSH